MSLTQEPVATGWEYLGLAMFELGAVEFGEFRLKLHETNPDAPLSPIFFNLRTSDNPKPGKLTPEFVQAAGQHLYELAKSRGLEFDLVAGVPRAGDPFAQAFVEAAVAGGMTVQLRRYQKEEAGGSRRIGKLEQFGRDSGKRMLLIDDLITQAGSKVEAIEEAYVAGVEVDHVLVLLDREQGGAKQLEERGYQVHSLFTVSELLRLYLERGRISQQQFDQVTTYLRNNRG